MPPDKVEMFLFHVQDNPEHGDGAEVSGAEEDEETTGAPEDSAAAPSTSAPASGSTSRAPAPAEKQRRFRFVTSLSRHGVGMTTESASA